MKHLASLNKYFWKYRWRFLSGIIFIIITNYFRILSPQLTRYVVNTVVENVQHISGKNRLSDNNSNNDQVVQLIIHQVEKLDFASKFLWCGIILLVLAMISGFFMFLMRQTIIVMSRLIEYDQKNEVFRHYEQLDTGFYKVHSTGDLMNRISEDVSRVRMYTGPAIMYFINLAAVLGFSIYFMLKESPRLTLIALSPLPLLAITIYFVNTVINRKSEKIQSLLSDLTTNAQESYSGIRVIKSFVQERAMLGFFKSNSEAYRKQALGLAKTEAIYFPSMALLIGVSTLLTIMAGGLDYVHGVKGAGPGQIAEFVLYIQMLTFPVSAIGWTASMTQRAAASQKRLNEFLLATPTIMPPSVPKIPDLTGDIVWKDVNFTYAHTGIHAIKSFNLSIRGGEKIAIVGKTGSGKSTIAQLLLRMYDPQSGDISIDGVSLKEVDLSYLRQQISYVPQEVFLFSETISHNIAFGLTDSSRERIIQSAKNASIHEEIMQFPEGYETMIGERGVTLSGGQKQRISIARAMIKDPAIVIFDDCLSAVDARTEKIVLGHLNEYLANRTAIVITHRIFSMVEFDQIVVLDDGIIVEKGQHRELLNLGGFYARMYQRQQEQENISH